MKSFKHITPASRIFCGPDSLKNLPSELKREKCGRVLIFCDPFLVSEGTLLATVEKILGDKCIGVFSDIAPGSPVPKVQEGAEAIKKSGADALVVIGGGSSTVTARAAIILAAENADPHDICTVRSEDGSLFSPRLMAPKIPMFIVPTTPITAMVKAGASILDPDADTLLALFDPKTRGRAIFIHPDFVKTMPYNLLLSASMSTLAAAIDGLFSKDGDVMSDALLIQSLRLLADNLSDKSKLKDPEVRCELMMATVLCGMGSDFTGFGISVVMGHAITAHHRVNAGFVNGVIVPHTLRYNISAVSGMKKLADGFRIDTGKAGFEKEVCVRVEKLLGQLDIPHTLRDMDVPDENFNEIAKSAMDDWYLHFNPIPVEQENIIDILKAAW